jgi:hypothetical protein
LGFVPNSTGLSAGYNYSGGDAETNVIFGASSSSQQMRFQRWDGTTLTNVLTLVGTGNVGIGTTSPSSKLTVSGTDSIKLTLTGGTVQNSIQLNAGNTSGAHAFFIGAGSDLVVGADKGFAILDATSGYAGRLFIDATTGLTTIYAGLAVTGTLSNTTNAELATSAGGNFVKIGSTTAIGSGIGLLEVTYNNAYYGARLKSSNSGGGSPIQFLSYNGTVVGTITHNDTVTTYGGTSDYRLKDITGPLTDSGTFIDALKPKVGTWKSNGSKFVGFIAHEFAEVSPTSVRGQKDEVDSDGKPVYQSMQASSAEVIANLVAELQSVRQRLAALEAK